MTHPNNFSPDSFAKLIYRLTEALDATDPSAYDEQCLNFERANLFFYLPNPFNFLRDYSFPIQYGYATAEQSNELATTLQHDLANRTLKAIGLPYELLHADTLDSSTDGEIYIAAYLPAITTFTDIPAPPDNLDCDDDTDD